MGSLYGVERATAHPYRICQPLSDWGVRRELDLFSVFRKNSEIHHFLPTGRKNLRFVIGVVCYLYNMLDWLA